jgi:peroxin-13
MPPTFSSSLAQSTSPAFALLESLISSITSLAQLLESTYFATHSSFFALAGVADQLGATKLYLGQVLGVFSVLRWGRGLMDLLRGRKKPAAITAGGATGDWGGEFASLGQALMSNSRSANNALSSPASSPSSRPSAKPLLFFLLTAVGLPFAMSRLINLLSARLPPPQPAPLPGAPTSQVPADLTFARASYKFEAKDDLELSLAAGEIVAVLEKLGGSGGVSEGEWWRGRTRDGRTGWFPRSFVVE